MLKSGLDFRVDDKTKKTMAGVTDPTTIMECWRGSKAFNLYIPKEENEEFGTDDLDMISVYHYPKNYYYTLHAYYQSKDVYEMKDDPLDIVAYEIKKMFSMMSKMNPNVITTLYTRKEDYLEMSEAWKLVMTHRDLFTGKRLLYDSTVGFAQSQKKRMMDGVYHGYMGEKRKRLLDKYGYDMKNAVHVLRILRMGKEFLQDGMPIVYREKDRDELLQIKTGQVKLDQVLEIIDNEFKLIEYAFQRSTLPEKANDNKINELLFEVMSLLLEGDRPHKLIDPIN